jgi:hypothetical protein
VNKEKPYGRKYNRQSQTTPQQILSRETYYWNLQGAKKAAGVVNTRGKSDGKGPSE